MIEASGLEARVIQHEIDHLDGVLILDRISRAAAQGGDAGAARGAGGASRRALPRVRTVYLGTSEFAAAVLRALADSPHRPALVVTRPDRPRGRGRKLAPPPVAEARPRARDRARPAGRRSTTTPRAPGSTPRRPTCVCVCAFGALITEPLLSEHEMLNVHPSLLPRWRGAAPIERAIMAGDERTGRLDHAPRPPGSTADRCAPRRSEPIGSPATPTGRSPQRLAGARRRRCWSRRSTARPPCAEQDEAGVDLRRQDRPPTIGCSTRAGPRSSSSGRVRALTPHIGAAVSSCRRRPARRLGGARDRRSRTGPAGEPGARRAAAGARLRRRARSSCWSYSRPGAGRWRRRLSARPAGAGDAGRRGRTRAMASRRRGVRVRRRPPRVRAGRLRRSRAQRARRLASSPAIGRWRWRSLTGPSSGARRSTTSAQQLCNRPLPSLDPPVLAALRLGLVQLLYLDGIAEHAAVHESVELAKRGEPRRRAGSSTRSCGGRRARDAGDARVARRRHAAARRDPALGARSGWPSCGGASSAPSARRALLRVRQRARRVGAAGQHAGRVARGSVPRAAGGATRSGPSFPRGSCSTARSTSRARSCSGAARSCPSRAPRCWSSRALAPEPGRPGA